MRSTPPRCRNRLLNSSRSEWQRRWLLTMLLRASFVTITVCSRICVAQPDLRAAGWTLRPAKRGRERQHHRLVSINAVVLGRSVDDLLGLLVRVSRGKSSQVPLPAVCVSGQPVAHMTSVFACDLADPPTTTAADKRLAPIAPSQVEASVSRQARAPGLMDTRCRALAAAPRSHASSRSRKGQRDVARARNTGYQPKLARLAYSRNRFS